MFVRQIQVNLWQIDFYDLCLISKCKEFCGRLNILNEWTKTTKLSYVIRKYVNEIEFQ